MAGSICWGSGKLQPLGAVAVKHSYQDSQLVGGIPMEYPHSLPIWGYSPSFEGFFSTEPCRVALADTYGRCRDQQVPAGPEGVPMILGDCFRFP